MAIFNNTATLFYNGQATNSNVVTGEILEVLSATKSVIGGTYSPGDTLTYVVSIVNSGTSQITDLTVTDNLGGYTFGSTTLYPLTYVENSLRLYTNGVPGATPAVVEGPPLQISGITVPAGGNVMLIYEADVNGYTPLEVGSSVTNVATVSGAGLANPIAVSAVATALSEPELTISKSVSPETVVENGQITYTFVIQNSGNTEAVATDNIYITDTFSPILSSLSVTLDGEPLSTPSQYTYDAATGTFETVPGVITVPAATYTQGVDGVYVTTPGVSVLKITGTV